MKAYKLKEDQKEYNTTYKKGRVFVQVNNQSICIATPVEETVYCGNYLFHKYLHSDMFEETILEEEKWLQPHICKEVRIELK